MLSLLSSAPSQDNPACSADFFFPLPHSSIRSLEDQVMHASLRYKLDWFSYNGGSITRDPKDHEKPTFFNIALNYVPLNMDQLLKRTGKEMPCVDEQAAAASAVQAQVSAKTSVSPTAAIKAESGKEPKKQHVSKVNDDGVPPAAVGSQAPIRSGISNLLGAWWGRS